ncbi:uncharacterized protein LOC132607657 [Lycium barbarum]|uniref:uncharacterized protein LOC132607657 n=1 Tax=Lycium barbarum TaxID=112863 RepID=UPI00293ED2DB|nr:uncharacterized protein LOC132607657 [Lycium barbarum]
MVDEVARLALEAAERERNRKKNEQATRPVQAIVKPEIKGKFELKEGTVRLVQATCQYMVKPNEDPHKHLMQFVDLSEHFQYRDFTDDYVKMVLFPFSLIGDARECLNNLPANCITSWEILSSKFIKKFFSFRKMKELRGIIANFTQKDFESLPQAWESLKGYLRDCPHHMQPQEIIVHYFIEGLRHDSRDLLNASVQGKILTKTYEEIKALHELISEGTQEYQETSRGLPQKAVGVLQVDDVAAIRADISTLTNVMLRPNRGGKYCGNYYANSYNPPFGKQDFHKINNYQQPQAQPTSNLEEMMKQLMAQQQIMQQQHQKVQSEMQKSIHELVHQMGQIANMQNVRPQGALPSDIEKNPKECNAVALRNGRELQEVPPKKKNVAEAELTPAK